MPEEQGAQGPGSGAAIPAPTHNVAAQNVAAQNVAAHNVTAHKVAGRRVRRCGRYATASSAARGLGSALHGAPRPGRRSSRSPTDESVGALVVERVAQPGSTIELADKRGL